MSSMAKKAREAMKNKAKALSSTTDPHQKVDSSTWSPAEPLNADIQTGMRPVSRQARKHGGKVTGKKAPVNMGKKARASGGKAIADAIVNRNVKDANAERAGIKHAGGMKKGGRLKREDGGQADEIAGKINEYEAEKSASDMAKSKPVPTPPSGRPASPPSRERSKYDIRSPYKKGGRTAKEIGGPLVGASKQMEMAQKQAGVPSAIMNFTNIKKGSLSPARGVGLKKGGAVHEDVAADKALIRKMVKPSARTGKKDGGQMGPMGMPKKGTSDDIERGLARDMLSRAATDQKLRAARMESLADPSMADSFGYPASAGSAMFPDKKKAGGRAKRKEGGSVFSGPSYPGKVPGATGGRTAHAAGGAAGKGKTDINIVIAAGKPQGDMMPPGGPVPAPGGRPVPVPPPAAAGAAPMPIGMPMPMPSAPPAGGQPQGLPAMPRKSGGRLTRVAKSYKDMEAGAGSGEGRLQKTDIAKRSMHNKGGKVGHRSYNNYKDMDAGAGSGFGRLEKTEMAKKHSGIQRA